MGRVIRYLIDTNILVYVHDGSDGRPADACREVVRSVGRARSAAIPVQALTEFSAVVLRTLDPPFPRE